MPEAAGVSTIMMVFGACLLIAILVLLVVSVMCVLLFMRCRVLESNLQSERVEFRRLSEEQSKGSQSIIREALGAIYDMTHTMQAVIKCTEGGRAELLSDFSAMETRITGLFQSVLNSFRGGTKVDINGGSFGNSQIGGKIDNNGQ